MDDILTVDARGLACPQPVLEAKSVLDQGKAREFIVLVDSPASKENVARFVKNQGHRAEIRESPDGHFEIRVSAADAPVKPAEQETPVACDVPRPQPTEAADKLVVYVGTQCMGKGDDELGAKLMRGFLQTLIDVEPIPWRIIFINSGVMLTTTDDAAVQAVGLLAERGADVLSCGTCLQHFQLQDQLKVGRVTNMFEVIETLQTATKVISPD